MLRAYKVFLATAYPPPDLVKTMKRLLACLALCASLSASAQDDNCTILGVQDLSSLYSELSASIDTIVAALQLTATQLQSQVGGADTIITIQSERTILDYRVCSNESCVNNYISQGYEPLSGSPSYAGACSNCGTVFAWRQAMVKYAED